MKSFIGALITLAILIAAITLGGICIFRTADEILDEIALLPPSADSKSGDEEFAAVYGNIKSTWEGRKFLIALSVSHTETDVIDMILLKIKAGHDAKDDGIYKSGIAELKDAVSDLKESESLSLDGIL